MDSTDSHQSEREAQKAQANREELVERLMRILPEDEAAEPLQGLLLSRASASTGLGHSVFFPAFCVIAQGRKEILLGENRYWYEPAQYLIATAVVPIASRITEASPARSACQRCMNMADQHHINDHLRAERLAAKQRQRNGLVELRVAEAAQNIGSDRRVASQQWETAFACTDFSRATPS